MRIALLTLLLVADATVAANLPIIVLIVLDNQCQTLLGTYGNTEILTQEWINLPQRAENTSIFGKRGPS